MEAPKILKWERKIRISLAILFFIVTMVNLIANDVMGFGDYAHNQFIIMYTYFILLILNSILYTWGKFRDRQKRNFIFNFQALVFFNILLVGLILYFNVYEVMDKSVLWSLFTLINGIYLWIIEHHYKKLATVTNTNYTYK
ncbi:hypothetical protein BUZ14_06825 [Staphylococcus gallinarum]|uniref:Uncharacterized protein n=1 Tax=Staphylococcus gallinarum TaxID=1293 RepID=A0A3A0W3T6_STAGA|nr:hypothetical protein [Staphylococcus gallinarum]RIP34883.1 hypothetical protein BUZ14_06825 [Staphylococcus gallinarum]